MSLIYAYVCVKKQLFLTCCFESIRKSHGVFLQQRPVKSNRSLESRGVMLFGEANRIGSEFLVKRTWPLHKGLQCLHKVCKEFFVLDICVFALPSLSFVARYPLISCMSEIASKAR